MKLNGDFRFLVVDMGGSWKVEWKYSSKKFKVSQKRFHTQNKLIFAFLW